MTTPSDYSNSPLSTAITEEDTTQADITEKPWQTDRYPDTDHARTDYARTGHAVNVEQFQSIDSQNSESLTSNHSQSNFRDNGTGHAKAILQKLKSLSQASWLAEASMLLTAFLWGVNIPIVKFAIGSMDALTFNAFRMVVSTIVLGIIVAAMPRKSASDRKKANGALLSGRFAAFFLVSGIAYPFVFMHGIDYTTSGNTAMLLATMPMWTAVISYVFLGERLPWLIRTGLLIAFCGTATVVIAGGNVSLKSENFIGNLLVTAAACCWASGTIISSPLLTKMSALRIAFWSSLLSTPVYLLYVSGELLASMQHLMKPNVTLAVIYSGLFSTGIAYATWYFGVQRLGSSRAAIYQNLVTFIAVIAGWCLLGEVLTLAQWIGGGIIITGLFIIRRGKQATPTTNK